MHLYKIVIHDKNYGDWSVYDIVNTPIKTLDINPSREKLFNNDVFSVDETGNVKIEQSPVRTGGSMPGVLVLKNEKTYGRKNGRLLYKCVPNDKQVPPFLVPYEIKHVGFSKVFQNMYVTFTFNEWSEKDKHPHGTLNQVIGPVDSLGAFYEYQLYCKNLQIPMQKFTKDTSKALKTNSNEVFVQSIREKHPSIEDRTNTADWRVFSIDPEGTADFDDAFSIKQITMDRTLLSVYIANVSIWLDALHLWESFSRRVSTIYLPDKKRPMLPAFLSEGLCSLQQNTTRFAFTMDVVLEQDRIVNVSYKNAAIRVKKNYVYEDPKLLESTDYKQLFHTAEVIFREIKCGDELKDSHDLVAYLMILMNYNCARDLLKHGNGIFRNAVFKSGAPICFPDGLPANIKKNLRLMKTTQGKYVDGADLESVKRHDAMELDAYVHITSPIRRLVDLLNMIQFQQNNGLIQLSEKASLFYAAWLGELDYINESMRAIRKVQTDCSLLEMCTNDAKIMEGVFDGYVFEKTCDARTADMLLYSVYLPELKLSCYFKTTVNILDYALRQFKLYMFHDEDNFRRKIRVQMV
jgi:exoribonuclease R